MTPEEVARRIWPNEYPPGTVGHADAADRQRKLAKELELWAEDVRSGSGEEERLREGIAKLATHAHRTHDHGWGQLLSVVMDPDGEELSDYIAMHEEDNPVKEWRDTKVQDLLNPKSER